MSSCILFQFPCCSFCDQNQTFLVVIAPVLCKFSKVGCGPMIREILVVLLGVILWCIGSRKRSRDGQPSSVLERVTANGSSKRMTPQRTSVTPRQEDPHPSWLTDFDKWLLTKLVCTSLLALVTERDSMYPEVSTMTSEKLVGGPPSSTLEEDTAFLKTVDRKSDPKLYHALSLRISERTILDKCATLMKIKSKKR